MKGFPVMATDSPAESRNKKKMRSSVLSEYEKRSHTAHIEVVVSKKIINGKSVISAKMCRNRMYDETMPLDEEYTDMDKFKKALVDEVQKVGKALK